MPFLAITINPVSTVTQLPPCRARQQLLDSSSSHLTGNGNSADSQGKFS